MPMSGKEVVAEIKAVATSHGVKIERRQHRRNFCTVYLVAPPTLTRADQYTRLAGVRARLVDRGVGNVKLTHFNNPPQTDPSTGARTSGHPRHGDPLIEIPSVWWEGP